MDKIEEFDIEIDLRDRRQVYDYGKCIKLERGVSEEWKPSNFHGLGDINSIDKENENLLLQVRLMDKAIVETKGFFQKEVKFTKEHDNNEEAILDYRQSRRILPIYNPGETVRGMVKLKLNEPLQAGRFSIKLLGHATTNIRIYQKHGHHDVKGYENYIQEEIILWETTDPKVASSTRDTDTTVSASPSLRRSNYLSTDLNEFPFKFQIPIDAAPSTPNLRPSCVNYCFLCYRLKAQIDTGKWFGRGDIVHHKGLWVQKIYDIGREPEYLEPAILTETLHGGYILKTGTVTLHATLPRTAFLKGRSIPIKLELENQTKEGAKSISARIEMHGNFKTKADSTMMNTQKIEVKGKKLTAGPIPSGMSPEFNWELPWDFSESSVDGNLMPTGTLDSCQLIAVRYSIIVKLIRTGLHRNLTMEIPIIIGDVNSLENREITSF